VRRGAPGSGGLTLPRPPFPRAGRAELLALCVLAAPLPTGCDRADAPAEMAGRPPADSTVAVPSGVYRPGSDSAERALGYRLSPPAVRRQGWYDAWERPPREVRIGDFRIDREPVTQAEYAKFVRATGHRAPHIDPVAYREQGFLVHPYAAVRPYLWSRPGAEGPGSPDGEPGAPARSAAPAGPAGAPRPPAGKADHPVVLVSHPEAAAYCAWRGGRLPRETEWEAACRGKEGRIFPWGDRWRPGAARVRADGTAPVDARPGGATPSGIREMAGNVFEWTASPFRVGTERADDGRDGAGGDERQGAAAGPEPALRSCSWDDAPGTCRCAFRHGRPAPSRHILIGFRCAYDTPTPDP